MENLGNFIFGPRVRLLEDGVVVFLLLAHLEFTDNALVDQFGGVLIQHGLLLLDLGVHEWLREHRLVYLIVSVPSVANLQCNAMQATMLIHSLTG